MWSTLYIIGAPLLCAILNHILEPTVYFGTVSASPQDASKYNSKETSALLKLHPLVTDMDLDIDDYFLKDQFLIRFLRARDFDIGAAATMFKTAMLWRKENKIDSILNDTTLSLNHSPYIFDGVDNDGRPLVLFTMMDVRKLLLSGKRENLYKWWEQLLERGLYELRKMDEARGANDKEITQFVAILDMTGFNLGKHFCLQCPGLYFDWLKVYESYFPDYLKYYIFINAFKNAVPLLEVFRPALSKATQKSLKIFGPQKKEWVEFLLSIIPADQLPVRYGGTRIS